MVYCFIITGKIMKKLIFLCLTILIILMSGCDEDDPDYTSWTFMIYLDGDNNLELAGLYDINEMESINLAGQNINIIVLFDRSIGDSSADGNWEKTRLYKIQNDNDSTTINSLRLSDPVYLNLSDTGDEEELNMGDPDTVTKFVNFCKQNYPAESYALVFWNHGSGWRSRSDSVSGLNSKQGINKAICEDEDDGDILYMEEVRDSLSAITTPGIDIVGFDACLMGMMEVAYQLRDVADYLVASEELEPFNGWAYNYFLYELKSVSNRTPINVGKTIIDTYIDNTQSSELTLSIVDLSRMDSLVSAIDTFATNSIASDGSENTASRNTVTYFNTASEAYIDLYEYVQNCPNISGADELLTEIETAVPYYRQIDFPNTYGLAIYFPLSKSESEYSSYTIANIDFPGASEWDEFLDDYLP